jgi:hypothetical protein
MPAHPPARGGVGLSFRRSVDSGRYRWPHRGEPDPRLRSIWSHPRVACFRFCMPRRASESSGRRRGHQTHRKRELYTHWYLTPIRAIRMARLSTKWGREAASAGIGLRISSSTAATDLSEAPPRALMRIDPPTRARVGRGWVRLLARPQEPDGTRLHPKDRATIFSAACPLVERSIDRFRSESGRLTRLRSGRLTLRKTQVAGPPIERGAPD